MLHIFKSFCEKNIYSFLKPVKDMSIFFNIIFRNKIEVSLPPRYGENTILYYVYVYLFSISIMYHPPILYTEVCSSKYDMQ